MKDYVLGVSNKNAALSVSNYLAIFISLEMVTLYYLPLLSKLAIMMFCFIDLKLSNTSPLSPSPLSLSTRLSQRGLMFTCRLLLLLALLYLEMSLNNVLSLPTSEQAKYFLCIIAQVVNCMYVYNIKLKGMVEAYIDREREMLKVKWIASMTVAFYTPVLVFLMNETQEYKILRFNHDPVAIVLLIVGTGVMIYWNNIKYPGKISLSASALKKE